MSHVPLPSGTGIHVSATERSADVEAAQIQRVSSTKFARSRSAVTRPPPLRSTRWVPSSLSANCTGPRCATTTMLRRRPADTSRPASSRPAGAGSVSTPAMCAVLPGAPRPAIAIRTPCAKCLRAQRSRESRLRQNEEAQRWATKPMT